MDITILNELDDAKDGLISNSNNLTLLMDVSPNACGSSYIDRLLSTTFDLLHIHYLHKEQGQSSYWDRCIIPYHNYFQNDRDQQRQISNDKGCDLDEYLTKFTKNINIHSQYIVFETAPTYISYYHSCYLLSHYAKLYPLYFYVSLRNPIHRTWSEYWRFYSKYNHTDADDINKIMDTIRYDIDSFPHLYPKYQKLLDYIKIDSNSTHNNNDIQEEKVIDLWIDASYDLFNNLDYNIFHSKQAINDMMDGMHSAFNIPIFASSCYYPQILMWSHAFKNNSINLWDKFKVFQFEWMHEKDVMEQLIKQVLLWTNNDAHKTQEWIDLNHSTYVDTLPVLKDGTLQYSLDKLYSDCNLRLYWFLNQNVDLLLLRDRVFTF